MKRLIGLLPVLIFLFLTPDLPAQDRSRNVILFLGDAAGIPTVNGASIYGYSEPRRLFVQNMPNIALSETSAASEWVTDSAAGMTAIVTGHKTKNGVISQSDTAVRRKKDGEPLKTILEYAEERGLSTGVISNSSVLSATPAACYAHVNDRKMESEILSQLAAPRFGDGVDIVIGPNRGAVVEAAKSLGKDLGAVLAAKGWSLYNSAEEIPKDARRAVVLYDDENFDLAAATERAIDILSHNPKGFFLMVESDIHTEKLVQGLERMVAFDRLIQRTAERANVRDTLVIFTADHSYDFRIHDGRKDEPLLTAQEKELPTGGQDTIRLKNVRRDDGHTGEEVLVSAQGPGAERVRGILSNTDLFHIMMAAYGWEATPSDGGE
jgi:alkaline phosphatase